MAARSTTTAAELDGFARIAGAWRGDGHEFRHLENLHLGIISVVSGTGEEVYAWGDTERAFPLRSTAKPFQLLPYLLDGLHLPTGGRPLEGGAPLADLALMMASHSGEPMHTERIARLLTASGLAVGALHCGTHAPLHEPTRDALVCAGMQPTALHCNCSGKHVAMLRVCRHRGWPTQSYTEYDHPLQQRIERILLALSGRSGPGLAWTIDGCSLPSFVLPVTALARLFAYLACPEAAPAVEGRAAGTELALLFRAATAHPEMIAGTGRLDTELMQALGGRLFAKSGAAGLYAMALAPNARFPAGLGVALKVADPDADARVRAVTALELLRQLGAIPDAAALPKAVQTLAAGRLTNLRARVVSEIRPLFTPAEGLRDNARN